MLNEYKESRRQSNLEAEKLSEKLNRRHNKFSVRAESTVSAEERKGEERPRRVCATATNSVFEFSDFEEPSGIGCAI